MGLVGGLEMDSRLVEALRVEKMAKQAQGI